MERLEIDYQTAGLEERQVAIFRYVEKLTRTPGAMVREDVSRLRQAGFADADILAVAEVAAYYAFVNRLAVGLGVSLESWNRPGSGGPT